MSTATANGDAGLKGGPAANKQQLKPTAGGKALDSARKQAGSPVDGQNRKQTPTPQRAWTGTNPITQRPTNSPNLANGSDRSQSRSAQPQHRGNGDLTADKQASERLLYLLAHCTGIDATLTLKNGEQFTGVFSGSSTESPSKSVYILKMVKKTRAASQQQINGNAELPDEYVGEGDDHVMFFDTQDTVDFAVANVVTAAAHATQNGSATSGFRTDTEISRDARLPRERELKKWDGGLGESLEDMALESTGKHGGTGWDQFAVNEQNFGTRTTYNEDDYTTTINRNDPEYRRRAAEAERIAREIEGSLPATAHVREERQQNASQDDGMDEEEKYSGVRRESAMAPLSKGGAGSYVPPSRRPLTSQPTVSGAPFDPAIISLSKPVAAPAAQPAAAPEKAAEVAKPIETSAKTEDAQPAVSDNVEKPTTAPSTAPPKKTGNTTEDHLRGTADAFKQFANTEKLRLRAAQEAKRSNARHEKNIKLNDLKKFAENFRLKSRVPDDLVPILAKDHEKQLEIKRKAEESARFDEQKRKELEKEGSSQTPPKSTPSQAATPADSRAQTQQSQSQPRNRVSQNLRGGMQIPSPRGAPLSQRQNLPFMHQARGGIPPPQPLPADLRIPSGPIPARDSEILSPTAAHNARLNVKAKEFKFTPGASSFTPTGASPSPQRMAVPAPFEQPTASFFDAVGRKSSDDRKDVNTHCDTIKFMREYEYPQEWKKSIAENGGVPQPFRTPPTWTVPLDRQNTKYTSAFPEPRSISEGPSPMHTPNPANGPMPHAHQLPPHLQAPHMHNPAQHPRFPNMPQYGAQFGHGQNFDPRMQFPGGPGSVQNSPRYQHAQMAGYNGAMGQIPMPQFAGQQMQAYGMSPNMGYRQMQNPGAPQMMMAPHSNMNQMRPGFPPGPNFGPNMPPQMGGGAPMMAQNSSSGFMPPQNQGYSPMPPHAQPQMPHMPQQGAGPNGYTGSPRPGPHMMQASGSHQGYAPQMQQQHSQHGPPFVPPFHGQQQGQKQGQRHPSTGGYPQMTPRSQQAMPVPQQQGHVPSPGMGGPVAGHGDK